MVPPFPPSPPSGPPEGTNFSRRKLTQPAPPSPPLTNTSISSTNMPYTAGRGARRRFTPSWSRRSRSANLRVVRTSRSRRSSRRACRRSRAPRSGRAGIGCPAAGPGWSRPSRTGRRSASRRASGDWSPGRSWGCRRLSCAPSVLDLDRRNADRRRRLAVTAVPAIVLPALEFHDSHLPAPALGHDLARHLRAAERLVAGDDLAVARDEQDGAKLDCRSLLARHLLDGDELARRHAVLLTPGRDHGFHVRPF